MSTCKITQKTCVTWHLCDFYFLINFCDLTLTLTFSNMTFVLTRYASQTFASTLCEFKLFAARLTDPTAQNVKNGVFYLLPDIELTHDIYLKMLNMH